MFRCGMKPLDWLLRVAETRFGALWEVLGCFVVG